MTKALRVCIIFIFTLAVTNLLGQDANGRWYSAGEIQSKNQVQYGRFEMLMYSSDMSGTTSTFFMWKEGSTQGNVAWNELDIETFGKSPDSWQSNPIWEYNGNDQDTKRWEVIHSGLPIANTWVKFTLEWTPDYIAWFNNDIEVRRIYKGDNVPANHFRYNGGDSDDPVGYIKDPMRMCFNHWATYPGDWLGPFNAADLPSYQFVDWFTYQPWNGTGFDAVSIRQDFNSLNEVTTAYNVSGHTFTENQCTFTNQNVGVTNGYLWLSITPYNQPRPPAGNEIPASPQNNTYLHDIPGKVEAEEFNNQFGLQTETVDPSEGTGENLGYTTIGDWAEYTIDVSEGGNYDVNFRVASLNGDAGLKLLVDGETVINDLAIPTTGDWQNWITLSETIALTAGEHTLRFNVIRAGFNLNWMDFTKSEIITSTKQQKDQHVFFYPNPVIDYLQLPESLDWEILSSNGILLSKGKSSRIEMQAFEKGMYFLKTNAAIHKILKQ